MDGLSDWYWLGVVVGLGVAVGVGLVAARARNPAAALGAVAVAIAVVVTVMTLPAWGFGALAVSAVIGLASFRQLSTAALPAAVLGLAALAFVPALGYLEALAAPLLGQRLSRRAGERYAGLRILARD